MKIKLLGLLIAVFLLTIVFSGCVEENKRTTTPVESKTIYVDDSGGKDYTTIKDAVNIAHGGDTIFVYSGIYYENIFINESVDLSGEDKESTIIYGDGNSNVLEINSDDVTITGFTFENSGNKSRSVNFCGIFINSKITIIHNNIFKDNQQGLKIICYIDLRMDDSGNTIWYPINQNHHIFDNIFTNNQEGIVIAGDGKNNRIYSNEIFNNKQGISLYMDGGNNLLYNNKIYDNSIGIKLTYSEDNFIFENLILNNTNYGIHINDHYGEHFNNTFFNNTIFKNNFIGNKDNAFSGKGNIWYNVETNEGNYWDDYNGSDLNDDGIGDTPYNITSEENHDNYPLMNPVDI
jgi:nitrous oxidase accessory protein